MGFFKEYFSYWWGFLIGGIGLGVFAATDNPFNPLLIFIMGLIILALIIKISNKKTKMKVMNPQEAEDETIEEEKRN